MSAHPAVWYDSTDPEVVQVWEKNLNREVRARGPLFDSENAFTGTSPGKMIQLKEELASGPGKSIRVKLRYQLEGRGRGAQEVLKAHGEGYRTATCDVAIEKIRHMVETADEIVDQWVHEDTIEEGTDALSEWFASRFEMVANIHAVGFNIVTGTPYTFHNTINALHSDYLIRPNGKTKAEDLTSADRFDVDLLNDALRRVKAVRPKIRPADTPLGPRYCVFLSPAQVKSLQSSDSQWYAAMQNALRGGVVEKNPVFTNALGQWQGFILFESDWVCPGIHSTQSAIQSDTSTAWVGGAQALAMAFGRGRRPGGYALNRYRWVKDDEDFGNVQQMAAVTICGMTRLRFTKPGEANAREMGVVGIQTYAAQDVDNEYSPWTDAGATIAT